jgi:hypothetical protein
MRFLITPLVLNNFIPRGLMRFLITPLVLKTHHSFTGYQQCSSVHPDCLLPKVINRQSLQIDTNFLAKQLLRIENQISFIDLRVSTLLEPWKECFFNRTPAYNARFKVLVIFKMNNL